MAAALTPTSKDRGGPKISFQALLIPATDASVDAGSYREYGTDRFLSRAWGGVSGVDKAARVENANHNQAPIGGDKIGEVVNPDNYSMTPIRFCWRSAGGEFLRTSVRDRQLHSINPTR
jgi:acetyl esterase/lipase